MDLQALIAAHLASPQSSWSIGAFGAIAEFHRDASEPVELAGLSAVTPRGAIALWADSRCRAFACGRHGVALCLPESEARMDARTRITGLGQDREALRPQDRDAVLFDLGLGLVNCEFCVRSAEPEVGEALRAAEGTPLLANAALVGLLKRRNPHRVVRSRAGRIEVFQDIAAEGGSSPTGPHTHLLPGLLRQSRTHAADVPIPEGWLPCLFLHPPGHTAAITEGSP